MAYIPGDFWRLCDECGFKTRSSRTRKRWDGAIVCLADWEPQHPQDFVRGKADQQNVPDPRPVPVDNLVGPLTTTVSVAASAGATTISVASSARMLELDRVGITMTNGDVHRGVITSIPNGTSITLTAATKLAGAVAVGALVVDYSALASVDIG